MSYEAWRISYQDSEKAARAAYDLAAGRWREMEKMRKAHDELLEIHKVIMCIAEAPEPSDADTYTVRGVKEMAYRIRKYERENAALVATIEQLRGQLFDSAGKVKVAFRNEGREK